MLEHVCIYSGKLVAEDGGTKLDEWLTKNGAKN